MPDDLRPTSQATGEKAPPASAPSKKIILLIEDDPFLVKMYKEKFEMEGFSTIIAEDGLEGLKQAQEASVDLILLDILIPKLSGVDLLARLRNNPKGANIPVIVLTNLTEKEDVKLAGLKVKEYLVKADYTPSQVVEKVRIYLGVDGT
jgi:DNA-binding response OmpR family regulator